MVHAHWIQPHIHHCPCENMASLLHFLKETKNSEYGKIMIRKVKRTASLDDIISELLYPSQCN